MKAIGYILSSAVILGLGLCVMLFGWGLEPKSWGWVIWGNIGTVLLAGLVQAVTELSK